MKVAPLALRRFSVSALATMALAATGWPHDAHGGELLIDQPSSVLAVVTHKAGAAARLAHNHLIVAADYAASLTYDPARPSETVFQLEVPVGSLAVDSPPDQERWFARLRELGILDQPFGEISEKNRSKVRGAMLGRSQLDGEAFPKLTARLSELRRASESDPDPPFPWRAQVEFVIRGQRVEAPMKLQISERAGRVVFEAFGALTLSDFGIEPYSALLGAVKNRDQMHVFLHLETLPATPPSPAE